MHNLETYLEFKADFSFKQDPYNVVDIACFAMLSYANFDIIKGHFPISIQDAYTKIHQDKDFKNKRKKRLDAYHVLDWMGVSKRYKHLKILDYEEVLDLKTTIQFAAITIQLDDTTIGVFFRGTDDSIIGWHEDFNMFTHEIVGAQKASQDYLDKVSKIKLKKYGFIPVQSKMIIAGHSKGGTLSISSALLNPHLNQRIQCIYNFDGPGFSKELTLHPNYANTINKVITYLPSYSFFGRLFHHGERQVVVESFNKGLAQHSLFSWEVHPTDFQISVLDPQVIKLHEKFNKLFEEIGEKNLDTFIDTLFLIFDKLNVETLLDLSHVDIKKVGEAMMTLDKNLFKYNFYVIRMITLLSSEQKFAKSYINLK